MKCAKGKWMLSAWLCLSVLTGGLTAANTGTVEAAASVSPHVTAKEMERERNDKLIKFEQAAEDLYRDMQDGNTDGAHKDMERLTETLEGLSFKGLTSVEGIHALAESIMDVRETLARSEISSEEWATASARLRLAVNSLAHEEQALWLQYYKVMADDLDNMGKGRAKGSPAAVRQAFLALQAHYEVIRPAAIIRKESWEIHRFDSWMSYTDRLSGDDTWDEASISKAQRQGERLLKELFGRKTEEPVFLPLAGYENPWQWTLLIGGWIMLALAYTGIRKYRANQSIVSVQGNKDRADSYRL